MRTILKSKRFMTLVILLIMAVVLIPLYISRMNRISFPIFSADDNTYEKEKVAEIKVDNEASLDEIISELTKELSKKVFKLPMEFRGFETIFGQRIAIVNLMEAKKGEPEPSWRGGYFQGSTGGAVTFASLTETFLQKDFNGNWIDGVKFLYEGKTIEFEHVSGLLITQYRTTPYDLKTLDVNTVLLEDFILKSKTVSESGREVAYQIEGEFPANVIIHYNPEFPNAFVHIKESPIRSMTIEVSFVEDVLPYYENFAYFIQIGNTDVFLQTLKKEAPEIYKQLMETEWAEASILLSSFRSWLLAESEYENTAEFEGFID